MPVVSVAFLVASALLAVVAAIFVPIVVRFGRLLHTQQRLRSAGVPFDHDSYHPIWGNVSAMKTVSFMKMRELFREKLGDDAEVAKQVVQKFNVPKARYETVRDLVGESLLTANGPLWQAKRKAMNPAFHSTFLQNVLMPVVIQKTQELMDVELKTAAITHERVNLQEWLSKVTLDVIGIAGFGHDFNLTSSKNSSSVSRMVLSVLEEPNLRAQNPLRQYYKIREDIVYRRDLRDFKNLGKQIIKDARAAEARVKQSSDSKSILSLLLRQGVGEYGDVHGLDRPMRDDELLNEIMTFLFAGHETSASTLAFMFNMLHFHPDVKKKLFEEIDDVLQDKDVPTFDQLSKLKYLSAILKEVLRLFPIGPATARSPEQDITIGGYLIPKGTLLLVDFYLLHRHPRYWRDPQKFDPSRFLNANGGDAENSTDEPPPFAYLPFAGGPRSCIGKPFAELEIKIFIAMICKKYDWKVIDTHGNPLVDDPLQENYIPLVERFDAAVTIRPHPFDVQFSLRT